MKERIVRYFACPRKTKAKPCGGELIVDNQLSCFSQNPREIKEGYLKCRKCGMRFPIFFGIPLLFSDLETYLRSNLNSILELSKKYGRINNDLLADSLLLAKSTKPRDREAIFENPKEYYREKVKKIFQSHYISSHYDDFLTLSNIDEPLYAFLKKYKNETPHLVLKKFLRKFSKEKKSLVLEVGCNVGGFLHNLVPFGKNIFGLDNSFLYLFFASCTRLHLPERIKNYSLILESSIKRTRPLRAERLENLTLICADADNLPFKEHCVSIVASCNLIDAIENPKGLLKEKVRVLEKGGLLLSSDPYQFPEERAHKLSLKDNQRADEAIKNILRPSTKIMEERDFTPWVIRNYRRSYSIYYNHSFCAKKN